MSYVSQSLSFANTTDLTQIPTVAATLDTEQLAYQIRCFSALLSGTRKETIPLLPPPGGKKHIGQETGDGPWAEYRDTLTHFSNLLTIHDKTPVVAVTANRTAEGVTTAVVYSIHSSSIQGDPSSRRPPFSVGRITPDPRPLPTILSNSSLPESVDEHVADVLALFQASSEGLVTQPEVMDWIVGRCIPRLRKRLRKITSTWTDLVILMKEWKPIASDAKTLANLEIDMHWDIIVEDLAQFDLTPIAGTTRFTIDMETATTWVHAIATMVGTVRDLTDPSKRSMTDSEEMDVKATIGENLVRLSLLQRRPIHKLFSQTSLGSKLKPTVPDEMPRTDPSQDDDTEMEPPSPFENSGEYALRYLRTLTSWTAAVSHLFSQRRSRSLSSASTTVIRLIGQPRMSKDSGYLEPAADILMNDITDQYKLDDDGRSQVKSWLDTMKTAAPMESACHIHAEAGLMALAFDVFQAPDGYMTEDYAKAFLDHTTALPIGVSKKCCRLCHRLGELLNEASSAAHPDDAVIRLPNSHGITYGWDPPRFGIPASILQRLRDELKDELVENAIRSVIPRSSTSRQASPVSGSSDAIVDIWESIIRAKKMRKTSNREHDLHSRV